MSYLNGTPFLNLPQTVGTDKRDWFDTNEAFLDLDAKLKSAYEGSIDTASALAALTEVVSGISSDVSDLQTTVGNHTTSIGTINEALLLINNALTTLNGTVTGKFDSAGVADPYDDEHGIYDVGNVVTYNGQRYVCHVAVTAAEPFDADKWTAVDIQAELDQIKNDVIDLSQPYSNLDVYVEGDGIATYSSKLDALFALIDTSKLTANSKLVLDIPNVFNGTSLISFTSSNISAHLISSGHIDEYNVKAASSTFVRFTFSDASVTDKSSDILASAAKIGIIY